ncbi:MAG: hypothetical protein ACK46X_07090 [Candidatus Sericytochromatia bacterium]
MRPLAFVTALLVLTGCSQPNPAGQPAPVPTGAPQTGPAAPATGEGGVSVVPNIDYPDLPAEDPAAAGGTPGATESAAPVPVNEAPVLTEAAEVALLLDKQPRLLTGGIHNLTNTALNQMNDQLVLHYGTSPDELATGAAGAGIQVAIKLAGSGLKQFKQTDVVSATVTYMEVDAEGSYSEWNGAFMRGEGDSTLSFDVTAADGKITFTAKGLLGTDGGWGAPVSQRLVDWTLRDASLDAPAPAATASPASGGGHW